MVQFSQYTLLGVTFLVCSRHALVVEKKSATNSSPNIKK